MHALSGSGPATRLGFVVVTVLATVAVCAQHAGAQTVCTAADIVGHDSGCPTGSGTCTLTKTYQVTNGCILNFDTRAVVLTGTLDINSGTVTLAAGSVTVSSSGFIDGRGNLTSPATDLGGMITINSAGVFTLSASGRIDVSGHKQGGTITVNAGTSITIAGTLNANQLVAAADGGNISLNAGTSIMTQPGSGVAATGGTQGPNGGGEVDLSAGTTITLGDVIDVHGSSGGVVQACAGGAIATGPIRAGANGDAGSGGCVAVTAGTGLTTNGAIVTDGNSASTNSGSGSGGMVSLAANFGALTISAAGTTTANGASPDGSGGEVDLFSQGNTTVQSGATVAARGNGGLSCGGVVCVMPNLGFTHQGLLDASGGAGGGEIDVSSGLDTMLTGNLDASGRFFGGAGGNINITAGATGTGALTVAGKVDGGGGPCSTSTGCGSGGCTNLMGCNITVTAGGMVLADAPTGGENDVTAREQLTISGTVNASATITGTNAKDGVNVLQYPSRKAPLIGAGAVTPPAMLSGLDTCTSLSQVNCLIPCPVCGNGKVEFPETCDDGNTKSCDGCSVFCQTESCDDGLVCTIDTCDPVLGCNHVPVPSTTPCTEPPTLTPTVTPTPTTTSTPTDSPTPAPTLPFTPTATATRTASDTPLPTSTGTVTPTPSVTPTPTVTATPGPPGDANCDARVTAADLPALVTLLATNGPIRCGADAQPDGVLDGRDLVALLRDLFGD